MQYQMVLDFWFKELTPQQWFAKSDALDQEIKAKFSATHQQAICGELFQWRQKVDGRLAEIIVLDQFSRNIFRDTAKAFAFDPLALILAQELVMLDLDQQLAVMARSFAYLPFMHSESKIVHEQALMLYQSLGNEDTLDYEVEHKAIIDRFGRYPHRNEQLGRQSTAEEIAFLETHAGF